MVDLGRSVFLVVYLGFVDKGKGRIDSELHVQRKVA